ncbi:MAG TPA: hypothetical protein PKM21_06540 [Anaerolineales bacterium]|nr:hypothetical protein [Anaerolineales bacterium]
MNTSPKTKLYITVIVLALCLVAILGYSTARSAIIKPKPLAYTPVPTDLLNSSLSEIQVLEQELQGDLDTETRKSLEAKLEILYSQATQQAIGIQQLTAMPENAKTFIPPTFEFDGQRETGIIQYPSVPFPSTEYKITNAWQDMINGKYVLVFAGTLASDPEQGVVVVLVESPRQYRQYLTPTKSGAISIADAIGFRLVIRSSDNNEIYYFDVPAQKFVNSLNEVVPTATALPTPTVPLETMIPALPYP